MTRTLSVRIDEDLYAALQEQADSEGRTLSNYVARLLAVKSPVPHQQTLFAQSTRKVSKRAAPQKRVEDEEEMTRQEWDAAVEALKPKPASPPATEVKRWSDGGVVE